jgi:membrane-associated phospholipid phosphatase
MVEFDEANKASVIYLIKPSKGWSRTLTERYRIAYASPGYLTSVIFSLFALLASLVASSFAVSFSTYHASAAVTDLILSNTPAYNVDGIYVYGALLFIFFIVILCVMFPMRLPFTLYSLALFFITRSFFVSLTHLGPFIPASPIAFGETIQRMFFGDDYFFSGHTGSPFLMALIYWQEEHLRYIFIALSVFFGAVVLLGHLHYSIDVFAAFFIAYGVYHLALIFFPKSRGLFTQSDPVEKTTV